MSRVRGVTPRFGLPAELAELADEYEIVEELGRGGNAIVYHARDRALGRDVAIKVVHPRPTSPDDDPVARLAREARTVAQLDHPGIVSVYAVRRLRAGGLTLVMQLVPGATLKTTIQRSGPLDSVRTEEILRDVADALAYAHARHLVHRDVKPENIFLHAESGRALLADFGIARSTEADSATVTGTAIGTPFYMSPEQVDGRPIDGRSDLYSLGLVAWEMLTGRRPWDGESLYHVIYKQKHDHLPPIDALRPDVPRRLQYIVERMLQKQPAARWAGAEGLLVQLDRRILPSDYAKWQMALPDRVAHYVASVEASRAAAAKPATVTTASAATVRFSPALAQTQRLEAGPLARENASAAPSVVGADPTTDEMAMRPAYDSAVPTWSASTADPRPRSRRSRYAMPALITFGALVGTSAVALTSRARSVTPGLSEAPPSVKRPAAPVIAPARVAVSAAPRAQTPTASPGSAPTANAGAAAPVGAPDLIGVGAHHVCSLTASDAAQCWGRNDGEQLGDGSTISGTQVPHLVAGVMTYTSLAAGASHTCGVTRYGDVYCWGTNEHGQLGDGTAFSRAAPVRVGGAGIYRAVRGGTAHTCGLDITGIVRCWGDNSAGQLGDGTRTSQFLPTVVHLPQGAPAIALAAGARHTCALLSDQRVVCWGANGDGQLGTRSAVMDSEPHEVPRLRATAIATGDAHTCAVLLDERVQCWGRDDAGQLGAGTLTNAPPGRATTVPTHATFRALAAGAAQSCGLTQSGDVWCWGTTNSGFHRTPVRLGRRPYVAVAASGAQTCAIGKDRSADCWRSGLTAVPSHSAPSRRHLPRPHGGRGVTRGKTPHGAPRRTRR